MNKVYKVIWNVALGTWLAVSELAKGKVKSSSATVVSLAEINNQSIQKEKIGSIAKTTALFAAFALISAQSFAAPETIAASTDNGNSGILPVENLEFWQQLTNNHFVLTNDKRISVGGSLWLGTNARAGGAGIAIGSGAVSADTDNIKGSVAIGNSSYANAGATVLGSLATGGQNAVALGRNALANDEGVAIGRGAQGVGSSAIAIGRSAVANGNNSIAIGNASVATAENSVSFGNATLQRKITNIASGSVNENSTDAMTGKQLFQANKNVAAALGGGAVVLADGQITAPKYSVGGKEVVGVEDAVTALDTRATTNETDIANNKTAIGKNAEDITAVGARVTTNTADISKLNQNVNDGVFSVSANAIGAAKVAKDAVIDYSNTDKNIVITQDGTNFKFDLANNLNVKNSIVVGESTLSSNGLSIAGGPSISATGINANHTVISNLKDGEAAHDAVNKGQLDKLLTDSGLVGDTGESINAVTYDKDGKVTLADNSGLTIGANTLNATGLSIAGGPSISATGINANNTVIRNLKDGEAAHEAVNKGQLDKLLTDSGLVDDAGESINAVTYDKDGKVTLADNSGLTIGANTLNAAGLTVGNTLITSAGLSFANGGPSISATGINANHTVISNLKDGEAAHDAVNKGQLDKLLTDSGLVGDTGESINAVTYDKDGKVTLANNSGLTIGANTLNAAGLTVGNTLITSAGLSFANGGPSISATGINANNTIISNLKDGVAAHDAVNRGQLDKLLTDSGLVDGEGKSINAVTYDKDGKVTLADNGGDGTLISNVAEGKVEAGSKDAVNGSQVAGIRDDLQAKIDGNTSAIGDIQKDLGTMQNDIGGIKQDLGTMQNDIGGIKQDLASGKLGVVQQADKDATITVGKETGGNKVDMSGTAGDRVVTGVANGAVQKDSKDAVNGSQLNTTNQAIVSSLGGGASFDSTTGEFNAPTYQVGADKHKDVGSAISALDQANQGLNSKIDNVSDRLENAFRSTNDRIDSVEKKANAGIAAAMALESAPFIAGKYTYSAGAAYHGGESAIGVTLRKTSNNGRWSVTGGIAAATQGDASVRIGVSGVIN